jgi:cytochrome subunit of sulfide dehydrogenase
MRISIYLAAALLAAPLTTSAQADPRAASLAATCASCHGTDGRSATKEVPSLAGLPKEHIVSQMKAFKDGSRPATVMHQLAKGYTDQQVETLAAYFAAQPRN